VVHINTVLLKEIHLHLKILKDKAKKEKQEFLKFHQNQVKIINSYLKFNKI
jgi:hypothetical protein